VHFFGVRKAQYVHRRNFSTMKRPLAKKEKRNQESDFVCDVVFTNKLPEAPYEPKFLKVGLDSSRHIRYRETTLERDYKFELICGVDLGVTLDMIDYSAFTQLPNAPPILEKVDEYLASGSIQSKQAHILPFLHKFNYLSNDITPQTVMKVETTTVPSLNSEVDTKEKLLEHIEASFNVCKTLPQHPHNPNLTVDAIFPIFPDEELWGNEYTEMVFDSDPLVGEEPSESTHTGTIVKLVSGPQSDKPLLGYFVPKGYNKKQPLSTEEPQIDIEEPETSSKEDQEFTKIRDYVYNIIPKGKITELQPFFFVIREDTVSYHPIKTRVTMQRPAKEDLAAIAIQPVTSLVVKTLDSLSESAKQQRDQQRRILEDQSAQGLY